MTGDEERRLCVAHAAAVLNAMNAPAPYEERAALVAEHLSVVDGQVVVTGGAIGPSGPHWVVLPSDGSPRMTRDISSLSGADLQYPVERLIADLRLVRGSRVRW